MLSPGGRIEELLEEIRCFRDDPERSDFTDVDFLLTYVESELEDCMLELFELPVAERHALLDRTIQAVKQLGAVGEAVDRLLDLFLD